MPNNLLTLFIPLILSIIFTNCINNVEDISSPININPDDVSYTDDIQPIFNNSCGGSGCHISNTQNGVNLSSYTSVMNSFGDLYEKPIITPNNAEDSPLVDKIESSPQFGSRMPLNGNSLTPQEITEIKTWINAGAEDN